MAQTHGEQSKRYGQVVAATWADPAFKRRLLADPATTLRERRIGLAAGTQVRVLEDTAQLVHLVLPRRPDELSDEQLGGVAGGSGKNPWPPPPPPPPGSARAGDAVASSMEL